MPLEGRNPFYYVENFEQILDTVTHRYADLLTAGERSFADDLRALPLEARCLYVRLLSRVGPWFRRDHLRYDEIPDLDVAIDALAARGLLDLAPGAGAAELLPYLIRDEIAAIGDDFGVTARGAKSRQIAALLAECDAVALLDALRQRVPMVAPLGHAPVTLFRLLFFGNLRQDWTELVLADLGVWRYETYALRRELRLFPTRVAIEDALAIRALQDEARAHLAAGDAAAAWTVAASVARREPPWDAAARAHADAILLEVARPLERASACEQALELYAAASTPPARERRARLLDRIGRERAAIALCREIAASPRDESERLFAARFEQRLRRRIGQVPPVRRRYRAARRVALRADPRRAVEDLALEHFAAAGRAGFHAENWLWLALYGLAFWDVVFAPVAGAFQHAFQDGPLDLGEPAFRARREGPIAARLAELDAGAWPAERLLAIWETKRGIRNRLVPWWPGVDAHLGLALSRLRGSHLVSVLDRLSRDLGRYGHGLPDLFLVSQDEPGFELLEVKSPGDRLRPEQVGWLDYLSERGLPSAVLAVEWASPSGTRFAAVESPQ